MALMIKKPFWISINLNKKNQKNDMLINFNNNMIDTSEIAEIPSISHHPLYGRDGYILTIITRSGRHYTMERWCALYNNTPEGKEQSVKLKNVFEEEKMKIVAI